MVPRWTRLWTLLCLVLVLQLASAESFRAARRQDDNEDEPRSITSRSRIEAKTTAAETQEDGDATRTAEPSERDTDSPSLSTGSFITVTTTGEDRTISTPTSTSILTDGALDNSTFTNVTIAAGQLPLQPKITPGWGVAGVILILTGIAYTLIGIKNRAINTFFSTAYAAALGITVLIVYVMSVPVGNAVQGGYVVAVVVSGCIVGAASMFFRELTEGLGCALGGFCVSMWLMCLVEGGLLRPVASKAIFIACFTLGGFAFYFSRYTRDWALILMIAFSGATITVLGIDSFSRAGLKEFWAYIWDLNDSLFPLGADTYPVTKGIRVETAAIIIIFLFGIVSQIKLWKIVREKREKRAEELAEGQRNLQEEEENVGRNIEVLNARDRRQWERVYGDGDVGSSTISQGSENGDLPAEKKLRNSHTDSSRRGPSVDVIEMTDMADTTQRNSVTPSLMTADNDRNSKITIRVAADEMPKSPILEDIDEKAASSDGQTLVPGSDDRRTSQLSSKSQAQAPEIVPLPFIIPIGDDAQSDAERSSIATFADDDEDVEPSARHTLAHRLSRLSHGSTDMLKRLSRGSLRDYPEGVDPGESTEDLVIPKTRRRGSDDGSMAATIDDESLSNGDRRSLPSGNVQKRIEITAELSEREAPASPLDGSMKPADVDVKSTANQSKADHTEENMLETPAVAKSAASKDSNRVSLTKERLPRSLSRVAMSYRTNEWAKHLSQADAPEPDELHIEEPQIQEAPIVEKSAPVHVEELQKTADQATPLPAITRTDSQASNLSSMSNAYPSRRTSRHNTPATLTIPGGPSPDVMRSPSGTPPPSGGMPRSSSAALRRVSGGIEPIAEERDTTSVEPVTAPTPDEAVKLRRHSTSPVPAYDTGRRTPISGVVSYSSPQTLLGQREMFLRNKSQGNLLASTPDLTVNKATSDAGSLYNYPMYAAALGADADDVPLSQRKQMIRHSSLNGASASRLSLVPSIHSVNNGNGNGNGIDANSNEAPFDSHQPKRSSTLPTPAAREAALASFRQSVQHELRAGTPVLTTSGRETPFAPSSLLGGGREAEVQRNIEMGRNILLGQKEAEAQRREIQRREREWADRAFDERMRNGDFLDIHREAMRRMQKNAKD